MSVAFERAATAQAPRSQLWDATELLRKVDNDVDLATELVAIFLEDAAEMSDDISTAVTAGDAARLASAAHAYKGSASAIGAVAVARAAAALETSGRAGSTDVRLELGYFIQLEQRLLEQLAAATADH